MKEPVIDATPEPIKNATVLLLASKVPFVSVNAPADTLITPVLKLSCNWNVPPKPLKVTPPVALPFVVIRVVPDVDVKLTADAILVSVYVIPLASLNVFPAIVSVTEPLCVSVLTYPVMSSERMVMLADRVELLAPVPTPSKNTSSAEPGTLALSCVFEALPQLVFDVALQADDDPPPTQYLLAL